MRIVLVRILDGRIRFYRRLPFLRRQLCLLRGHNGCPLQWSLVDSQRRFTPSNSYYGSFIYRMIDLRRHQRDSEAFG